MLITFDDQDGDPVAVDAAAIIGLSIGTVNGPHKPGAEITVTLIWTMAAQPFMVRQPFSEVLEAWETARRVKLPPDAPQVLAYRGVYPLVTMQYPDGAR